MGRAEKEHKKADGKAKNNVADKHRGTAHSCGSLLPHAPANLRLSGRRPSPQSSHAPYRRGPLQSVVSPDLCLGFKQELVDITPHLGNVGLGEIVAPAIEVGEPDLQVLDPRDDADLHHRKVRGLTAL